MNHSNLMPPARQAQHARRRALRRWVGVCAGYLVLLGAAAPVVLLLSGSEAISPAAIAKVRVEISKSTARLASVRTRTAAVRGLLHTAQRITEQPDWSILLSAIAKRRGDEIVLSSCDLTSAPSTSNRSKGGMRLHMEGVGLSQEAVAAFVLRLQTIPVLQDVKLLQTTRKQTLGIDAHAFVLVCTVAGDANDE